jgi:uncharacterized protein with HEPN domain
MPPTPEDRLLDILEAIGEIDAMLAGYRLEQFNEDRLRRMATERYLEIVCETARKLPDDIKQGAPEIDWRAMIDFGNRLRHAYHQTDANIVWIVQDHLPRLRRFVKRHIPTAGR